MTFDLNEYAESMRDRVAAAKAGDERAGRFLLQEFVNHADLFRHADLQESDRIVLDFIVGAIREILEGITPRKALCLSSGERGNRPKDTLIRDMSLAFDVLAEVDRLRAGTEQIEGGVISNAQKRIAMLYGIKQSLVRSAWEGYGHEQEVRRLRDEFFPQWIKPNPMRTK
jgi:hypothetical protein